MPSLAPAFSDAPLRLRPEIAQLGPLTAYIEAFAERNSWAAADTLAFTLAAEELLANTVRHSDPPARSVEFALESSGDRALATYSDDGAMFDPTTHPEPDTTLPVEQRPIGGLGIHFIRRTMSTFAYRREGERNVILFGRTIGAAGR